jgi:hypothetical protein
VRTRLLSVLEKAISLHQKTAQQLEAENEKLQVNAADLENQLHEAHKACRALEATNEKNLKQIEELSALSLRLEHALEQEV